MDQDPEVENGEFGQTAVLTGSGIFLPVSQTAGGPVHISQRGKTLFH